MEAPGPRIRAPDPDPDRVLTRQRDDFTSALHLSSAGLQLVFLAGTFALVDTFQREVLTQQEEQRRRRGAAFQTLHPSFSLSQILEGKV